MGEKNNGNKKGGDGGKKEKGGPLSIVLNAGCLCEGCKSKIKCIRQFEGVENVKIESSNAVTVVGAVDPKAIVEKLRKKTGKIVEVISIQPKKDDNNKEKKPDKKENKDSDNKPEKKPKKETGIVGVPVTKVLRFEFHQTISSASNSENFVRLWEKTAPLRTKANFTGDKDLDCSVSASTYPNDAVILPF